ncbi:MAG: hypothetical protein LAP86_27330 [Acidobacteriia bacterium]|nr:hypothetical protein [Terriglobia bacterium]
MSRTPTTDDWRTLYREAILESDPANLPGLIDLAYRVVQRRAFELWYMGAPATRERHELDNALYFLDLLRKFGPQLEESPRVGDVGQRSPDECPADGSNTTSSTTEP